MIEVHFHCLPGIDDGPEEWDEAVALCRAAASEGTIAIMATPHVLRGRWVNDNPNSRDALIIKLNAMLGGTPAILSGCEYLLSSDAVELVERGKWSPLTTLNRGRYLLVEFPPGEELPGTGNLFHELLLLGVTPVVAHPERSRLFAKEPGKLEDLIDRGACVQITAGSLLGDFGVGPLAASVEFLLRGLGGAICLLLTAVSLAHYVRDLRLREPAEGFVRRFSLDRRHPLEIAAMGLEPSGDLASAMAVDTALSEEPTGNLSGGPSPQKRDSNPPAVSRPDEL